MATIIVRGRKMRVQAKAGTQLEFVKRIYERYTDVQLDKLEAESNDHKDKCSFTTGER